jgi:hypothetical protein
VAAAAAVGKGFSIADMGMLTASVANLLKQILPKVTTFLLGCCSVCSSNTFVNAKRGRSSTARASHTITGAAKAKAKAQA